MYNTLFFNDRGEVFLKAALTERAGTVCHGDHLKRKKYACKIHFWKYDDRFWSYKKLHFIYSVKKYLCYFRFKTIQQWLKDYSLYKLNAISFFSKNLTLFMKMGTFMAQRDMSVKCKNIWKCHRINRFTQIISFNLSKT